MGYSGRGLFPHQTQMWKSTCTEPSRLCSSVFVQGETARAVPYCKQTERTPSTSDKRCLAVFWTGDRCGETTKHVFLVSIFSELPSQIREKKHFLCQLTLQERAVRRRGRGRADAGYWLLQRLAGRHFAAYACPCPFRGQMLREDGNSSIVNENPTSTLRNGICFIGDQLIQIPFQIHLRAPDSLKHRSISLSEGDQEAK